MWIGRKWNVYWLYITSFLYFLMVSLVIYAFHMLFVPMKTTNTGIQWIKLKFMALHEGVFLHYIIQTKKWDITNQ